MAASFRTVFAHREFRVLWLAGAQSQIGDQLARVALSVLVFARTGSALATASVYALTYLPAMLGGVLLAGLADRYPRRGLLVVCDLIRAGLFAAMALSGLPLIVLAGLLVVAVLAGSPFKAAEPAVVADMFDGERYSLAIGLRTATVQAAQLIGFGVGGVAVSALGARPALVLDAATFAVSAGLLRVGLVGRPAATTGQERGTKRLRAGLTLVFGDRRLRVLLGLSWLAGWWIVPEGLAAPYAAAHGGGAIAVGVLLAANPVGNLIGAMAITRWLPARIRTKAVGPLAIAAGLPLIACAANPPLAAAAVLWAFTGFCAAYQVQIVTEFVLGIRPEVRGRAIGVAGTGLLAAQGLGLLVGGALSQGLPTGVSIAVAGACGVALAVPLAIARIQVGVQAIANDEVA